jgi:hypothetical protein
MATLFENQALVRPERGLLETTATTDVAMPIKYTLPIVRKVYPQLIVNEIAAIQPMPVMSGGSAQIFYLTHKRSTSGLALNSNLSSDFATLAENAVPKKIKLTVTSETITAKKRMLAAEWKTEVMEDARFSLGLDIEQELVNAMSDELLRELNYEFLNVILLGATAGDTEWDSTVVSGRDPVVHWQTLYDAFVDASNDIFTNRYQDGEYIICGTTLAGYVAKMRGYTGVAGDVVQNMGSVGIVKAGTLLDRWTIYKTTLVGATRGIMGIYPRSQINANFIYAPYVPLTPMPLIYAGYDEDTGNYQNVDAYTRNVRTRDAHKLVNPDAFSTITVTTT